MCPSIGAPVAVASLRRAPMAGKAAEMGISSERVYRCTLERQQSVVVFFFFSPPKPVLFILGKHLMLTHFGAEIKAKLLS